MSDLPTKSQVRVRLIMEAAQASHTLKALNEWRAKVNVAKPHFDEVIKFFEGRQWHADKELEFFDIHGRAPEGGEYLYEDAMHLAQAEPGYYTLREDLREECQNTCLEMANFFSHSGNRELMMLGHDIADFFETDKLSEEGMGKFLYYIKNGRKAAMKGSKCGNTWERWKNTGDALKAIYHGGITKTIRLSDPLRQDSKDLCHEIGRIFRAAGARDFSNHAHDVGDHFEDLRITPEAAKEYVEFIDDAHSRMLEINKGKDYYWHWKTMANRVRGQLPKKWGVE